MFPSTMTFMSLRITWGEPPGSPLDTPRGCGMPGSGCPSHPPNTEGCIDTGVPCIPMGFPASPRGSPAPLRLSLGTPRISSAPQGYRAHPRGVSETSLGLPRTSHPDPQQHRTPPRGRARRCGAGIGRSPVTPRSPPAPVPPPPPGTHAAEQGADAQTGPHGAAAAPRSLRGRAGSARPGPAAPARGGRCRLPRGGPCGGGAGPCGQPESPASPRGPRGGAVAARIPLHRSAPRDRTDSGSRARRGGSGVPRGWSAAQAPTAGRGWLLGRQPRVPRRVWSVFTVNWVPLERLGQVPTKCPQSSCGGLGSPGTCIQVRS